MDLRCFGFWLSHDHNGGAVCSSYNSKGYGMTAIITGCSLTTTGLLTLGAVHDSELIPGHIRLNPESHSRITGRILHRLVMHFTEISSFLLDLINMKNVFLIGLGMGAFCGDERPLVR